MELVEILEKNLKKEVDKLVNALKTEVKDKENLSSSFEKKTDELRKQLEEKMKNIEIQNQELKEQIKLLEERAKVAVNIPDKVNEFIKITESKKISQEATQKLSEVFTQLINEELKVILKLADSFSKRREKDQIDKESLDYGLQQLISSERLLKKAIELVHKINF